MPTLLLERGYSRRFEYEADAYSASFLRSRQIDPMALGEMLRRLMAAHGVDEDGAGSYLATHPSTRERIEALSRQTADDTATQGL